MQLIMFQYDVVCRVFGVEVDVNMVMVLFFIHFLHISMFNFHKFIDCIILELLLLLFLLLLFLYNFNVLDIQKLLNLSGLFDRLLFLYAIVHLSYESRYIQLYNGTFRFYLAVPCASVLVYRSANTAQSSA